MMAIALQTLIITGAKTEAHAVDRARMESVLDASIPLAVLGITDPRADKRWRVDGTPATIQVEGQEVQISVQDQSGLIDINAADITLLRQLLQSVGLADAESETIADHIVDWRSNTGLESLHGATDADYAAAGLSYRPRHAAFQSVDELQLVLGITPKLFDSIKSSLTVYTGRPMFDTERAPSNVFKAFYFLQPEKFEETMAARGADDGSPLDGKLSAITQLAGKTFSVLVDLKQGSLHLQRQAVIRLTGDDSRPYFVMAWK